MIRRFLVDAPVAASSPLTTVTVEPDWVTRTTPFGSSWGNEILYADGPELGPLLERAQAAFSCPFKWTRAPGTGPDGLADTLLARGFEQWEVAAMSRDPGPLDFDRSIDVITVGPDDIPAHVARMVECWEFSDGRDLVADYRARLERGWTLYEARRNGVILGVAGLVRGPAFGYLCGAATHPRHRGQGAYRALVARRLADLDVEAITLARVHSSAPRLQRWGFRTAFRYRMFLGSL